MRRSRTWTSTNGLAGAVRPAQSTVMPFDDRAATRGGSWHRHQASNRYLGSVLRTSSDGATLRLRARGTRVWLIGDRGPELGRLQVRIDDGEWRRVDTQADAFQARRVLWSSNTLSDREHTVRVRNLATSGRPRIAIDGIAFIR